MLLTMEPQWAFSTAEPFQLIRSAPASTQGQGLHFNPSPVPWKCLQASKVACLPGSARWPIMSPVPQDLEMVIRFGSGGKIPLTTGKVDYS